MIDGIAIAGYRSFGSANVHIRDLSRVNVFIGKNNSGKSNILRFVAFLFESMGSTQREDAPKLDPHLDYCLDTTSKEIILGLQIKKDGFTSPIFDSITEPFHEARADRFLESQEDFWFYFQGKPPHKPSADSISGLKERILDRCSPQETNGLTSQLCGYTQGSPDKRATDIAGALHKLVQIRPSVHQIEAFRRILHSDVHTLSGGGLIRELRDLQSPELANYQAAKERFAKITGFLRSILGEPTAFFEIPAEKDEIYVSFDGKVLPLESLGTGIHELIILAAAVTLADRAIFCIEEPEIHLHPELQKKFVRYILEETTNQYLIASHSNAFLDLSDVNVYRCWLEKGHTNCELASSASEKHAVLTDLGYRPSDLLQTNYVIWVEGPSDRIYINHWIKAKAPELLEGLHYAIMFYGGRLLSHLCYDDPAVIDFVRLSSLNRNASMVIDSDKNTPDQAINATKTRVKENFKSNQCLVWITEGRTIENYVAEPVLNKAVCTVHPRTDASLKWERFADLTRLDGGKIIDKVAVARAVVQQEADFSVLDLGATIDALIGEIRISNAPQ
jgi:predicted ATPase